MTSRIRAVVLQAGYSAAANTTSGQCHRYTEYEMRPRKRTGARHSARFGSGVRSVMPPTISSAVAAVGSRATAPGNGVVGPMRTHAATNSATPAADAERASGRGRRVARIVTIPISAPSASSHARVNVEK